MRTSDGFVLPLILILLLVMSLLIATLSQTEAQHLALFAATRNNQTDAATERGEAKILAQQANSTYQNQAPAPTTTPQPGIAYLRYVSANERIWQIQTTHAEWRVRCTSATVCEVAP